MEKHNLPENKKKLLLNNSMSSPYIQFAELQKAVTQLGTQNKKKLEEIVQVKPNFNYQLCKIHQNKAISLNFGRELLIKQMDKLMEEENHLNRQLSLITIEDQESTVVKERLIETEVNPFEVLRSAWSVGAQKHENSIDHAQALNMTIGHIKLSIRKIIEIEQDNSHEKSLQYLKTVKKLRQPSQCINCKTAQQSKNQLRTKISELQSSISHLSTLNRQLSEEITKKDDSIRRLNKKMIEMETESHSKIMYLQQKLLMEDHQVKQLKKFKSELEKNAFDGHNFQIYLKTQQDLSHLEKQLSVDLQELLDFIAKQNQNISISSKELEEKQQQKQAEPSFDSSNDLMQLELALPIGINQKPKKPLTERPKSDRRMNFAQNTIRLQQLQSMGKKYLRTNQLTTKRARQVPVGVAESKCTITTLKLSDSPPSIDLK